MAAAALLLASTLSAACADPLVPNDCPPGAACAEPQPPDVVLLPGDNGTTRAVAVGTTIGLKLPYQGTTDVVVSNPAVLGAVGQSPAVLIKASHPGDADVTVRSSGYTVHVEVKRS